MCLIVYSKAIPADASISIQLHISISTIKYPSILKIILISAGSCIKFIYMNTLFGIRTFHEFTAASEASHSGMIVF